MLAYTFEKFYETATEVLSLQWLPIRALKWIFYNILVNMLVKQNCWSGLKGTLTTATAMESSNYEKQNFYGNILDSDADSSHYSDMQEILNNYRPQVFEQASIPSGSYTTESIVYDSYSGYAYNDSGPD